MQINKLQFIFWMQTVILKYSLTSCKDSYLHKVIHFDFSYISSILKYKLQLTLLLLYDGPWEMSESCPNEKCKKFQKNVFNKA